MEDLHNITLVGWSYGGAVITGAVPQVAKRIKSLVYLDAFVPECGESVADCSPPAVRSALERHKGKDEVVPPLPLEFLGITSRELVDFAAPRLSGQPWRTLFEPLQTSWSTTAVPKNYIRCGVHDYAPFTEAFERMRSQPEVRTAILNAPHACMLTHAPDCIRSLLSSAQ
jgi:pimeloyl-ACP methyl ester carboxylesterase